MNIHRVKGPDLSTQWTRFLDPMEMVDLQCRLTPIPPILHLLKIWISMSNNPRTMPPSIGFLSAQYIGNPGLKLLIKQPISWSLNLIFNLHLKVPLCIISQVLLFYIIQIKILMLTWVIQFFFSNSIKNSLWLQFFDYWHCATYHMVIDTSFCILSSHHITGIKLNFWSFDFQLHYIN